MSRARNIKPGFFSNEELVELPFETRLLFIGLWTLADREGRLEDRPKKIKMAIFPADNVDVDACLSQLQKAGFVLRYEANGLAAIQIINFTKHQNPHVKEAQSSIPAPDKHGASTVQAPDKNSASPADSLIPDSLSTALPEQCAPPTKKLPEKKRPDAPATRLPADWGPSDQDVLFCRQERPDIDPGQTASRFRDYWVAQPGAKGRKADWPATWRNWVRNEKPRAPPRRQTISEERLAVSYALTGRKPPTHERPIASPERDITGEATRLC